MQSGRLSADSTQGNGLTIGVQNCADCTERSEVLTATLASV